MKVNLFNHWFKYKVPVDTHIDRVKDAVLKDKQHYLRFWGWLNDVHDVGQYYKVSEGRNYMVFHNRAHYMMFLLKL
jgi:endonuclease III